MEPRGWKPPIKPGRRQEDSVNISQTVRENENCMQFATVYFLLETV